MRIATRSQNSMNKDSKGVFEIDGGKFIAYITKDYKRHNLGTFDTYQDAVNARIEAENYYFGEFSYHNSVKEDLGLNDCECK